MSRAHFELSGVASAADAPRLLDEICDHFVEHADVRRSGDMAFLSSKLGTATIRLDAPQIHISLSSPSEGALRMVRTSIAEHMFYFAGTDGLELSWSQSQERAERPYLHHVTVMGSQNITPNMRRVRFACADVAPFIGGDMHVRLLIPPKGRAPVWPRYRADGRIAWPDGDDALTVRAYTIRAVDAERSELWIDFFQHPLSDVATPGADFARDARPGDRLALMGPGSGSLPNARSIVMIGDESALPAIARITAEVPEGTFINAIIEVSGPAEEQALQSRGELKLRWLHRDGYEASGSGALRRVAKEAIAAAPDNSFIWVACEKADVRHIKAFLGERKHARAAMYAAWYWER